MIPLFRPSSFLSPFSLPRRVSFFTLFVTFTPLHLLKKSCLFSFFRVPVKEALGETTGQPAILLCLYQLLRSTQDQDAALERSGYKAANAATLNLLPLSFSFSPSLLENHFSTCLSPSPFYTLLLDLLFSFFSSLEEAIWRNVVKILPVCDVFTSYWDELRRICSVDRHALYKYSAVALKLLMLPLPPPASSLLSLVFSFSLRV